MEYGSLVPVVISTGIGLIVGAYMHRILRGKSFSTILSAAENGLLAEGNDLKLVMVVRTDLGMGKGKIAAQCSHAAVSCYKRAMKQQPKLLSQWESLGQPKVVLKIDSEDALYELAERAKSLGIVNYVIHDAGRTQIVAGSATVIGIGPGPVSVVNTISGHLKLL